MYYHTCPKCGNNLDPGEKCDCEKEKRETKNASDKADATGQNPIKN